MFDELIGLNSQKHECLLFPLALLVALALSLSGLEHVEHVSVETPYVTIMRSDPCYIGWLSCNFIPRHGVSHELAQAAYLIKRILQL